MAFFDVSSGRSAKELSQLLVTKFDKFDLNTKLVVMDHNQKLNRQVALQALFTPCYAHAFNFVLTGACSSIQSVRVFIATLSGFFSYFSKSTKGNHVFDEICDRRMSSSVAIRWNFTSPVFQLFTIISCWRFFILL